MNFGNDTVKNETAGGQSYIGDNLDFAAAEAYNLLRSSLAFACPRKDDAHGRKIGITSSCPHEGKSLTALNLAYSVAKTGEKVLLIDGDMRRPTLARSLGLEIAPGLSNLLISSFEGNFEPYIKKAADRETLFVLTAGDVPPNPSELIGSDKMKAVLRYAAEQYDCVIVDLPPVLAVADAMSISPDLDGIAMVIRHNESRSRDVMEAVRRIRFAGAHLMGFVYNGNSRAWGRYLPGKKQYNRYGYYDKTKYY